MIKAVVFDCFGVLYGGTMQVQIAACPLENQAELIDMGKQNDYGFLDFEDYTANVARLLRITPEQVKALFHDRHVRNEPLFDFIHTLRSRGVKIGLLTNAGRDMPGAFFSAQELNGGIFDAYIVSSEQGIIKPNPAIFSLMAEKLGITAGECVMVDDMSENCEGAEVAGMQSIQFITNEGMIESLRKILQSVID